MITREWSTACKDWEDRIVAKKSLIPFEPLNPTVADAALKVFNSLVLTDVIGKPNLGDASKEWVKEFVSHIFGSYDEETGRRLISEFFLLISKKNAKSTVAAGIMLTALILNNRHSAELVLIAPTKEVANNSFIPMRDMIRESEELSELLNVSEHTKVITHMGTGATLKVLAAENDSLAGIKASYILIDELWLFGKRSNAASLIREATGGLASRPEGFVVYLTTQSPEAPQGVFKSKLDYARDVRDGIIEDNQFLGLLYEFPTHMIEDDLHLDKRYWYITNPNMGTSVDEVFIEREFKKAERAGVDELQDFTAKHLNVEIGMNLRANRWSAAEYWSECEGRHFELQELINKSEIVTVGIDGGGLDDLLGLTVIGRLPSIGTQGKEWMIWTHAYCHSIVLERRKSIAPTLRDFQDDGDLTIVDNIGDDVESIAKLIKQIDVSGKLNKVGLDANGIGALLDALDANGISEGKLEGIPQGFKMTGYMQTAERKIASKSVIHANQKIMEWSLGNCRVKQNNAGMMIAKQESGTAKIDNVIALLNATALMALNPQVERQRGRVFF